MPNLHLDFQNLINNLLICPIFASTGGRVREAARTRNAALIPARTQSDSHTKDGQAAEGQGHAHVWLWDLHGRVVPRRAARTRHNGLHRGQQVRAAHGQVCGRLRRHAAEAAWTREAAAGGSGRQRGGVRRARTDGVRVEARARGCLACFGAARACPAGGSVARWEHAAGHA
jgi:hypothetical protein